MNHRVQVFISGCLTLKLSGSWKTVISSVSLYSFLEASLGSAFSSVAFPLGPAGEIGMVSRGTGDVGFAAVVGVLRVAIFVSLKAWRKR